MEDSEMWRATVSKLSQDVTFHDHASKKNIAEAEKHLGIRLPKDLIKLLCESDGIEDKSGCGLIWPLSRIVQDNLAFRSNHEFKALYMSFDSLLFFADAGNGDQFAYAITGGCITNPDIYIWNHENDSRSWVAGSLQSYLDGWLTGKMTV
jgi:hypothetical protein